MTDLPDPIALDACWDESLRGGDACPDAIAPDDRGLVLELINLEGPKPDRRFVHRLEEELMSAAASASRSPRLGGGRFDLEGRPGFPVRPGTQGWRPRRGAMPLGQVSTALLVLLVLLAVFAVFGRPGPSGDDQAIVPGGGTPHGAAITDEVLLDATFPALPGDPSEISVWRWTLDPGVVTTRPPGDFPAGVRVDYVLAGRYVARVDGPLLVARVAEDGTVGEPESVEPGTEVELGPGDAAVYPENDRGQAWGNAGAEPLVLLVVGVSGRPLPEPPAGLSVETLAYLAPHEVAGAYAVPDGPTELTIRRLTLAPGSEHAESTITGPRVVHVEEGSLTVTRQTEAQAVAGTPGTETVVRAGDTVRAASGAAVVLTNATAAPLVLLVTTIGPPS
jgi:uncharacterized cupin superfamily protein